MDLFCNRIVVDIKYSRPYTDRIISIGVAFLCGNSR